MGRRKSYQTDKMLVYFSPDRIIKGIWREEDFKALLPAAVEIMEFKAEYIDEPGLQRTTVLAFRVRWNQGLAGIGRKGFQAEWGFHVDKLAARLMDATGLAWSWESKARVLVQ